MKEIKLTQEKIALVDDTDFERVNQFKWYAHKEYGHWYALRAVGPSGKQSIIRMHRFILGVPQGAHVDHIDNNGLNNVRQNIRTCTRSQNQQNRVKQRGSSQYKGVVKYKNGRWNAGIRIGGKRVSLGYYKKEIKAAIAYDETAIGHYGKFARTNKMMGLL